MELRKLWFVFLVIAATAFFLHNARASCISVDVMESGKSCSNPKISCFAQYSTRGCNPNDPSDYHCRPYTDYCCKLVAYPNAVETTPCPGNCGGHPCSPITAAARHIPTATRNIPTDIALDLVDVSPSDPQGGSASYELQH